jgi:hypothetical protein
MEALIKSNRDLISATYPAFAQRSEQMQKGTAEFLI